MTRAWLVSGLHYQDPNLIFIAVQSQIHDWNYLVHWNNWFLREWEICCLHANTHSTGSKFLQNVTPSFGAHILDHLNVVLFSERWCVQFCNPPPANHSPQRTLWAARRFTGIITSRNNSRSKAQCSRIHNRPLCVHKKQQLGMFSWSHPAYE